MVVVVAVGAVVVAVAGFVVIVVVDAAGAWPELEA